MSFDEDPFAPRGPEEIPMQGQVQHHSVSAVVPQKVGSGLFSNGVLLLCGPHEVVLDFLLRLGEQQRVVARVILPYSVARQLAAVLDADLRMYERQFGSVPRIPRALETSGEGAPAASADDLAQGTPFSEPVAGSESDESRPIHPENLPEPPRAIPTVEDIYHELKVADDVLVGAYANSVLVRHSATEFCFDFITNIYPRSAVSARVFMAVPHVVPLLASLVRSMQSPGDGPRYA